MAAVAFFLFVSFALGIEVPLFREGYDVYNYLKIPVSTSWSYGEDIQISYDAITFLDEDFCIAENICEATFGNESHAVVWSNIVEATSTGLACVVQADNGVAYLNAPITKEFVLDQNATAACPPLGTCDFGVTSFLRTNGTRVIISNLTTGGPACFTTPDSISLDKEMLYTLMFARQPTPVYITKLNGMCCFMDERSAIEYQGARLQIIRFASVHPVQELTLTAQVVNATLIIGPSRQCVCSQKFNILCGVPFASVRFCRDDCYPVDPSLFHRHVWKTTVPYFTVYRGDNDENMTTIVRHPGIWAVGNKPLILTQGPVLAAIVKGPQLSFNPACTLRCDIPKVMSSTNKLFCAYYNSMITAGVIKIPLERLTTYCAAVIPKDYPDLYAQVPTKLRPVKELVYRTQTLRVWATTNKPPYFTVAHTPISEACIVPYYAFKGVDDITDLLDPTSTIQPELSCFSHAGAVGPRMTRLRGDVIVFCQEADTSLCSGQCITSNVCEVLTQVDGARAVAIAPSDEYSLGIACHHLTNVLLDEVVYYMVESYSGALVNTDCTAFIGALISNYVTASFTADYTYVVAVPATTAGWFSAVLVTAKLQLNTGSCLLISCGDDLFLTETITYTVSNGQLVCLFQCNRPAYVKIKASLQDLTIQVAELPSSACPAVVIGSSWPVLGSLLSAQTVLINDTLVVNVGNEVESLLYDTGTSCDLTGFTTPLTVATLRSIAAYIQTNQPPNSTCSQFVSNMLPSAGNYSCPDLVTTDRYWPSNIENPCLHGMCNYQLPKTWAINDGAYQRNNQSVCGGIEYNNLVGGFPTLAIVPLSANKFMNYLCNVGCSSFTGATLSLTNMCPSGFGCFIPQFAGCVPIKGVRKLRPGETATSPTRPIRFSETSNLLWFQAAQVKGDVTCEATDSSLIYPVKQRLDSYIFRKARSAADNTYCPQANSTVYSFTIYDEQDAFGSLAGIRDWDGAHRQVSLTHLATKNLPLFSSIPSILHDITVESMLTQGASPSTLMTSLGQIADNTTATTAFAYLIQQGIRILRSMQLLPQDHAVAAGFAAWTSLSPGYDAFYPSFFYCQVFESLIATPLSAKNHVESVTDLVVYRIDTDGYYAAGESSSATYTTLCIYLCATCADSNFATFAESDSQCASTRTTVTTPGYEYAMTSYALKDIAFTYYPFADKDDDLIDYNWDATLGAVCETTGVTGMLTGIPELIENDGQNVLSITGVIFFTPAFDALPFVECNNPYASLEAPDDVLSHTTNKLYYSGICTISRPTASPATKYMPGAMPPKNSMSSIELLLYSYPTNLFVPALAVDLTLTTTLLAKSGAWLQAQLTEDVAIFLPESDFTGILNRTMMCYGYMDLASQSTVNSTYNLTSTLRAWISQNSSVCTYIRSVYDQHSIPDYFLAELVTLCSNIPITTPPVKYQASLGVYDPSCTQSRIRCLHFGVPVNNITELMFKLFNLAYIDTIVQGISGGFNAAQLWQTLMASQPLTEYLSFVPVFNDSPCLETEIDPITQFNQNNILNKYVQTLDRNDENYNDPTLKEVNRFFKITC